MLTIQRDRTTQGHTICRPVGDLDAFTVRHFRQAVADLAGTPRLIIDLSGTTFIDSAGLGALIGAIRRTREAGGEVAVACDRANLVRVLHGTGFDRVVTVAPTITEAGAGLHTVSEAAAALRTIEADRANPPLLVDRLDHDPTS